MTYSASTTHSVVTVKTRSSVCAGLDSPGSSAKQVDSTSGGAHQLTRMRAHSSLLLGESVDVPVYSLDQIVRATLTRCQSAAYCI